ncbi:MAG: L,D-transpeptidase family protein [Tateyamaria sp.]|uniref:L,D-transpeptidase family protein n=1 Tax=Tateyamaria sp. TaxID=1929288 RepID=UPI00326870FA
MRILNLTVIVGAGLALQLLLHTSLLAGPIEDEVKRLSTSFNTSDEELFGDAKLDTALMIPRFYEQRGFTTGWHGSGNEQELLTELNRGVDQGFLPTDFNLALLYELQEKAKSGEPDDIATFDLVATDAAIKLIHHMVFGKVDPSKLDSSWNFSKPVIQSEPSTVLNEYLDGEGFSALMKRIYLGVTQYHQLVDALETYRSIELNGGWPFVPDETVLKPGMTHPAMAVLRERLIREGVPQETNFQTSATVGGEDIYDDALVEAVKAFQTRHGLEADGVVGPRSFQSLNRKASERVDQLRLSLERARWLMRELADEFVLVNIAGARTYFIKGDTVWSTRSVTGSAYRKTPVFRDDIQYMEFNPTWTVPASIFRKDKLSRIRNDPEYLARNDYKVVRSSDRAPVNAASVNWASDSPGVTLVQQPGPNNALGRVKFMFPNEYAVYLHDTNQKELFDRNDRNLSSGCVRLEHPFEFASLLMEGQPNWNNERMNSILDSGKTTRIELDKPVPVLLTYWTAWVETGNVHFREDPYERDAPILEALNR